MDLTELPLEVLLRISDHLSSADVFRCCTVSRPWRQVFDSDIFWKKRYSRECVEYLGGAECLVEPKFDISFFPGISESRAKYMRDTHLSRNWRAGRYHQENAEFDCDDTISYNIKVEFFDNNHLLIHRTFETEVWNVSETPSLIITIPFFLTELWETNIYKSIDDKLVVVQCNVVQVFNISLNLTNYSLAFVFFFNKTEDFSSNITGDTDVNALFEDDESSYPIAPNFERVIHGEYLVGTATDEKSLVKPVLHIWNVKSGKKLMEWSPVLPQTPRDILFIPSGTSNDKIAVIFDCHYYKKGNMTIVLIDLSKMSFQPNSFCNSKRISLSNTVLCDKYLCVLDDLSEWNVDVFDLSSNDGSTAFKTLQYKFRTYEVFSLYRFSEIALVANIKLKTLLVLKQYNSSMVRDERSSLDVLKSAMGARTKKPRMLMPFGPLEVVFNSFLAFHDDSENLDQIYEVVMMKNCEALSSFRSVVSFPEDTGRYRAVNEACTRIAVERANTVVVFSFW